MIPPGPRVSHVLMMLLLCCAWFLPATAAHARQDSGAWGEDGCYYEGQSGQWVMTGCLKVDVNGAQVFVSVQITGSDGYAYYYVYDYGTGMTTWYVLVAYDNGTTQWVAYADFLSMQRGGGGNACDVVGGGQAGCENGTGGGGQDPCSVMGGGQPGCGNGTGVAGQDPCAVMQSDQPGCGGSSDQPPVEGDVTQATGSWGADGCYYSSTQVMEGCLQYSDDGNQVFVSVEILDDQGYRYYYTHDYVTGVTTWYTLVTYADGSIAWMNLDEYRVQQGAAAEVPAGDCGVVPAGQPGSACDVPYAEPQTGGWDVTTLSTYVYGNLETYWIEWFSNQGWQYVSPTYTVGPNLSSSSSCTGISHGPFYCSDDQRMYLDEPWLQQRLANPGDFAVALVVAHEYGHHIQSVIGWDETNEIPHELGADCLAGVWANTAYYQGILDDGDIDEGIAVLWTIGDDFLGLPEDEWVHGTSEQRRDAFLEGYNSGDPMACFS